MQPSRDAHLKSLIRRRYAARIGEAGCSSDGLSRIIQAGYCTSSLDKVPQAIVSGWSGCGALAEGIEVDAAHTIVDVGCGSGLDAWILANSTNPPERVIAVDLTPEVLAGLPNAADQSGHCKVHAIAADMEQLPLADVCCDLVIANAAFNLAINPQAVFKEAFRILRPGGRLCAVDLIKQDDLHADILADPMAHGTSLGGVMTEPDLQAIIEAAGFACVTINGHRPFPPVISVQIRAKKQETP